LEPLIDPAAQTELEYLRQRVAVLEKAAARNGHHAPSSQESYEQLRQSEAELQLVLNTAPAFLAYLDRDCRYRRVNRAYEEWFGLKTDEIRGKTVGDAFGEACYQRLRPYWDRVLAGESVRFESLARRPEGEERYLSISCTPDRDQDGKVCGVLALVQDITERKQAEEAQLATERQLLLLMEASAALLATPHSTQVLRTIVDLAQHFIAADGHAVWQGQEGTWRLTSSAGLSEMFVATGMIFSAGRAPLSQGPIVIENILAEPLLAQRHEALLREGVQSMLVIPLRVHGQDSGTLVFYWKKPHRST
jgi:PAS domain S-box-containing protein